MSHRYPPPPSWKLPCPWCDFHLRVFARGQRGRDEGAGVEAAQVMEKHVAERHAKTWREFLEAA